MYFIRTISKKMDLGNKIFGKNSGEKGISLVELVVAVSVFSLVIITASSIFINAIKAQKVIAAKQNISENMRYAMEFMVKELRMAQENNSPGQTFNDGAGNQVKDKVCPKISFKNGSGKTVTYEFDSTNEKILRTGKDFSSSEVKITAFSFTFNDWYLDNVSGTAPLITIFLKAKAVSGVGGEMEMQTSVSPRIY